MKQTTLAFLAMLAAAPTAPPSDQVCPIRPPPAACAAPAPRVGELISGPVLQVVDGRNLCVALGPTPRQWVAIEVADAPADVPRGALMAVVFGRTITCVVTDRGPGGRARALCVKDGESAGRLAGAPDARAQAAAWR
ncbi:MAG TPA: hypothetical protein VME40_14690 [Caulobacteraceae bacterium]|nr:hypothetical protein [Caulobacteraceae bacterium]